MSQSHRTYTSLSAATAVGAGSAFGAAHPQRISVELTWAGSPEACGVRLQGSNDGVTFTDIGSQMNDAPTGSQSTFPYDQGIFNFRQYRLDLKQMDGGSSPTCTGKITMGRE